MIKFLGLLAILTVGVLSQRKFNIHYCPPEVPDFCTEDFNPVCGWYNHNTRDCSAGGCSETFDNACKACANPDILFVTCGECEGNFRFNRASIQNERPSWAPRPECAGDEY